MRASWLALMALIAGTASCRDSGEPPLVAEEVLQGVAEANQVIFGGDFYAVEGGIRRAFLVADTAYVFENEGLVELRQLRVTFFDSVGDTTSVLTAKTGKYDMNTGDMTAEIDVVVINPSDDRLETSVLYYNQTEDRIWSDQETKMIYADGTIVEGTAFESNSSMNVVDLTSPRMFRPGAERQPTP